MFDAIGEFFDFLGDILKKLWGFISDNPILAVLAAAVALVFLGPGALVSLVGTVASWVSSTALPWLGAQLAAGWGWFTGLTVWEMAAVGLGLGFIFDPEATTEFISDVAGSVGDVIEEVAESTSSGLVNGFGPVLLLGALGIFLLTRNRSSHDDTGNGGYNGSEPNV